MNTEENKNEESEKIDKLDDLIQKQESENITELDEESNDEDKMAFGFSFNAQDGVSGDESEDNGDLPGILRKPGHRYDSVMDTGHFEKPDQDSMIDSMHIAKADEIGFAYGEDTYVDPEE